MRLNTLEKLHACLRDLSPRVEMEEGLRLRAKESIDRMLALS
jgi:quinolinate synthase